MPDAGGHSGDDIIGRNFPGSTCEPRLDFGGHETPFLVLGQRLEYGNIHVAWNCKRSDCRDFGNFSRHVSHLARSLEKSDTSGS